MTIAEIMRRTSCHNSIDNDGMMTGHDIELVRSVTDAVKVLVIAIGGARGVA